jgi:hypothetical protein
LQYNKYTHTPLIQLVQASWHAAAALLLLLLLLLLLCT